MSVISNNPEYAVVLYTRNHSTDFGIGTRIMEINNVKNLGWADYLNDVPEAFFSLYQEDEQVEVLQSYTGRAHVRIFRIDPASGERSIVWAGIFGTETDEQGDDVIFYAHGYLAPLYWLLTGWADVWTNFNIKQIVDDVWDNAKNQIVGSELKFIGTGTTEAPATTSGGATPIILPTYTAYYKPSLNVLRELQAVARSDTTNVTVFEITHSETPTFNFWKNKGVDTNVVYTYGGMEMQDFWYAGLEAHRRNEIAGVGTSPRDLVLRSNQSATYGEYGRKSAPVYFQWVRDQTELDRITKLRLAKANRDHFKMGMIFYPGGCVPPGMSYSPWKLADRVRVRINRGVTNVDQMMIVIGVQTLFQHGVERVTMIVETPTGT
jgi:hypothetical protein